MKTLVTLAILGTAITVQNAGADTYKCIKNGHPIYQSSPCDRDNPDANKVDIKEPTAEEKALAAERLQQIKSEYDTRKQSKSDQNAKSRITPTNAPTLPTTQDNFTLQNDQTTNLEGSTE